jgi:hypothetical protein
MNYHVFFRSEEKNFGQGKRAGAVGQADAWYGSRIFAPGSAIAKLEEYTVRFKRIRIVEDRQLFGPGRLVFRIHVGSQERDLREGSLWEWGPFFWDPGFRDVSWEIPIALGRNENFFVQVYGFDADRLFGEESLGFIKAVYSLNTRKRWPKGKAGIVHKQPLRPSDIGCMKVAWEISRSE